jgi:hypothetical protein
MHCFGPDRVHLRLDHELPEQVQFQAHSETTELEVLTSARIEIRPVMLQMESARKANRLEDWVVFIFIPVFKAPDSIEDRLLFGCYRRRERRLRIRSCQRRHIA